MNLFLRKNDPRDWEDLGYQTMLHCRDNEERARNICGLHIHACADQLQPEIASLRSEIERNRNHGAALHSHLYDRPVPVNDAAMLTHSVNVRILRVLTTLAAIACLVGNTTTFVLFGYGLFATLIGAMGATALPLVVGHLAYEHIVARYRKLQNAVIVLAVLLCFAGVLRLAEARQLMVEMATTVTPVTSSYVDGQTAEGPADPDQRTGESTEAKVRETLAGAMLLIMISADLMLGFLVGRLAKMHTDGDYAAWRKLREISALVTGLEKTVAGLLASIEIAKKRCSAGILRAQVASSKRRIPYHRALGVFVLFALLSASTSHAQSIERYEGILIDTSGSISKAGTTDDLFKKYLISTKKLLTTEPPNSRVWVSSISVDSFGGEPAVVKGWTPDARGVFTDDLNRARRQLAFAFEQKSSGLSPLAAATDIFGALWRFKTLFESAGKFGTAKAFPKTIFIFSDMMNETQSFQMPTLLSLGPERMLERAKVNGLVVPMNGYSIYIYGATPSGLSPQAWLTVKTFWTLYFQTAGAELVTYSAECDAQRY